MRFYAVQTGETTWEKQARLDSLTGAPLSEKGRQDSRRMGMELAPHEPTVIYASGGQAEQETAGLLAEQLDLKIKHEDRLCEIDYGLWQGLTKDEIKRRQPRLHRQWQESPASTRPPGGETLQEAQQRLVAAIRDITRKEKKQSPILVLRPMVMGLLRCRLAKRPIENIWSFTQTDFAWTPFDFDWKADRL
jgi:broad specificity phosphatase PhoE